MLGIILCVMTNLFEWLPCRLHGFGLVQWLICRYAVIAFVMLLNLFYCRCGIVVCCKLCELLQVHDFTGLLPWFYGICVHEARFLTWFGIVWKWTAMLLKVLCGAATNVFFFL